MRTLALAALAAAAVQGVDAQDPKEMVSDHVLANASEYGELAAQSLAEVGYQEYESTRLLQSRGLARGEGVAGDIGSIAHHPPLRHASRRGRRAKVYLARAGLLDDVDAVLHWHAGSDNNANPVTTTTNISAKFRFRGVSSHAARAPEHGRSAFDGVEAMNHMVNLMREHVPQETRMHYVITSGGSAPNVGPDYAEAYHYVRHPDADMVRELFERLVSTAGAAVGTGTWRAGRWR